MNEKLIIEHNPCHIETVGVKGSPRFSSAEEYWSHNRKIKVMTLVSRYNRRRKKKRKFEISIIKWRAILVYTVINALVERISTSHR